jgi:hypothetical protein
MLCMVYVFEHKLCHKDITLISQILGHQPGFFYVYLNKFQWLHYLEYLQIKVHC